MVLRCIYLHPFQHEPQTAWRRNWRFL